MRVGQGQGLEQQRMLQGRRKPQSRKVAEEWQVCQEELAQRLPPLHLISVISEHPGFFMSVQIQVTDPPHQRSLRLGASSQI